MKYSADELANKLEQKARELREHGLSDTDMDKVAGGGCTCCGSSCQLFSGEAYNSCSATNKNSATTGTCLYSCISSSPD